MYDVARCSPRGVSRKIVEIYRRPETTVAHKGHLDIFDRELFISDRLNIRRLDSTDEFSYPAGKVTQFSRSAVDDSIPAFRPRCPQKHSIHFRGSLGDSCACSHFTTTGSRARDTQCAAQPTSVRVQKWDISKCFKKKKKPEHSVRQKTKEFVRVQHAPSRPDCQLAYDERLRGIRQWSGVLFQRYRLLKKRRWWKYQESTANSALTSCGW